MAYRGEECNYGQISCNLVDSAMYGILTKLGNSLQFENTITELVGEQVNSEDLEKELDSAIKAQRQALGVQRKLEDELDKLDVTGKYYDRKYENLSRRIDDAFEVIEEADRKVEDCEARLDSVKKQKITKESVYESLRIFATLYDEMNDHQRKAFVNTFIESIELYPDKGRKNGSAIKKIRFKFPVSYGGKEVYEVMSPLNSSDETVVLLGKRTDDPKDYVKIGLDVEDYYKIKDVQNKQGAE